MNIKIPFSIQKGEIQRDEDRINSINQFIELIVETQMGSFIPDKNFGFIFKNFQFEIFDEQKGTLKLPEKNRQNKEVKYEKKISGSAKNHNTFAYDLKKNIERYETRLKNVEVKMKYEQLGKIITLSVTAELNADKSTDYKHEIIFQVW